MTLLVLFLTSLIRKSKLIQKIKKKTIWLIEMHTQKIANEYKNAGTYTWLDNEWINIDYGNNFTQNKKWYKIKTN